MVGRHTEEIATGVAGGAFAVGAFLGESALAVVFGFFLLKDGRRLGRAALRPLRADRARIVKRVGHTIWVTIGSYMRGVAIVATCNAAFAGVAMWLIGVPLIGPIMVLTFIGSFVPFAGSVIAGSVATLIALANGSVVDALLVVVAMSLIQGVEGNLLQPVVVGKAVSLHPIVVLGAVGSGAILGGIPGAFLAVPIVASLTNAWSDLRRLLRAPGNGEAAAEDDERTAGAAPGDPPTEPALCAEPRSPPA